MRPDKSKTRSLVLPAVGLEAKHLICQSTVFDELLGGLLVYCCISNKSAQTTKDISRRDVV